MTPTMQEMLEALKPFAEQIELIECTSGAHEMRDSDMWPCDEAEKRAAQADNLIKAWAALRLIYEAVGEHAPPGTLPSEETLVTPLDYAEHIVQGIEAIAAGTGESTKP